MLLDVLLPLWIFFELLMHCKYELFLGPQGEADIGAKVDKYAVFIIFITGLFCEGECLLVCGTVFFRLCRSC